MHISFYYSIHPIINSCGELRQFAAHYVTTFVYRFFVEKSKSNVLFVEILKLFFVYRPTQDQSRDLYNLLAGLK